MAFYLYARVSTDLQQNGEGAQLHEMRAHLGRLEETETAVFFDRAECRETSPLDRPGFRSLMAVVQKGDTILAKSWDRLGTIYEAPGLVRMLAKKGINVAVCQGGSTESPEGMLMSNLLLSVAQFEVQTLRKRTRDALAERRRQGLRDTRRRYGWQAVDGRFIRNEAEQQTIAEIQEAVEMGETLRSICADLEARGIAAPEGGSKWQPSTISRLLRRISQTAA